MKINLFPTAYFLISLLKDAIQKMAFKNNFIYVSSDKIKVIEGGSQAGNNLFHSFEQFSIPTNQIGYFNNYTNIFRQRVVSISSKNKTG